MIRMQGVTRNLGGFSLQDIDLCVEEGEFFVLMGPSGAGKTLLLELMAGLASPDSGRVNGVDDRALGFIYQDYMLFPHMDVFKNIAYGLKVRKIDKKEIRERVHGLAEELHLLHLLRRDVRTLSGGEKQRVAIARALAIRPRLLLLDEPTAALDRANRLRTQKLLRRLHSLTGATFVQVTHDFEEALSLADRVALMMDGRLIQTGPPDEILTRPASREVADFMGYRNIFSGPVRGGKMRVGNWDIQVPLQESEFAYAAIRAEDILVSRSVLDSSARNHVKGRISAVMGNSAGAEVLVDAGVELVVGITRTSLDEMGIRVGDEVILTLKVSAIRCFEH
ncbi:MAG TPA: ATP-binding cassette domain-containing protein [Candidatus Aminicenantes bacterium]|nr:ATP-binding cassette domain-containing protein [Candidatus Aminicenantes bacterium]